MEKCIPTHPLKIHSHSQWWFASILENNNRNLQFKCIRTEFGEIMVGVEFFLSQFHLLFVNCITNEIPLHFWGFFDRESYKLFYALSKIQQTKIAALSSKQSQCMPERCIYNYYGNGVFGIMGVVDIHW